MRKSSVEAFFELIRSGLWVKEVLFSQYKEVDFAEVYRLAQEQSVVGLVAAGLEQVKNLNVPQALTFAREVLQIEQRNKAMNTFISLLIEKMRAADIYTLLVKGQGVAQCYEKPLWRVCGDVDFFLSDDNYEKAKKFLTSFASEVETENNGVKHLGMVIDGWVVELHGSLRVGLSYRINSVLDEIKHDTFYNGNVRSWNNNGTWTYMLSKENDIVYVFVHYLNHFYKEGVGLRQICDWCKLLWTYRGEINIRKIEECIRKMDLLSEWHAFGAYAVEYLGMPVEAMPMYSDDKKWKHKAELINNFILGVGNMGHSRDSSYMKFPYFIRKCYSARRRISDIINHARIFPLDSLRFFPNIMWNGVKRAIRGE